jgi:hypothetical protein
MSIYRLEPSLTLMKSPLAKSRNSDNALESALRGSPPSTEFPLELHVSIMHAVQTARRAESTEASGIGMIKRFVTVSWLPVAGFAGLVLLGVLLSIHNQPVATPQNPQPLADISNAFVKSQELMDSLPSATVGPLSDELDKVNRDLDRTAKFLLAALP